MNKRTYIIFIIHIFLIAKVEYLEAVSSRNCISNGQQCNPVYLCPCCPKLYFEDGTNGGYPTNIGYFCNMKGAIYNDKKDGDPYHKGCCQECTSEGDGCTSELRPCCPDQTPAPDASCSAGQTSCKRKSTNNTLVDGDHVPRECAGALPECYGEGNKCYGDMIKCCEHMDCKPLYPDSTSSPKWGVCTRVEGYTGKLAEIIIRSAKLAAPLAPECWNYGPRTTSPPPITPAATTPALTTPTVRPKPSCATRGKYCDGKSCCKGLTCPTNYLPLYLTRGVLNWVGIWNRVCRDYSPFSWYKPFTWVDY